MIGGCLFRLLVLALAWQAGSAAAETYRLRSGEHADFSRLVLDDLPKGAAWTLGRAGEDYDLHLALDEADFDIAQVYRLIPKTRLLGLEDAGSSTLRLRVAADHHATAFETDGGALVIDVRPGPPPAGSPFEQPVAPAVPARTTSVPPRPGAGYRPATEPPPRLDLFWPGGTRDTSQQPPALPPLAPLAPGLPDPRVVQAEADLMMQLGRAAAQGLVEIEGSPMAELAPAPPAAPVSPGSPAPEPEPPLDGGHASPREAGSPAPPAPAGHLAIHAETSIDRAMADEVEMPGVTSDGESCLPDVSVDLANWGDDRAFSEQLADAQVTLLGEFDQPDPAAVERLVKLYLHHGFGAEARATAAAFGLSAEDSVLLLTLAQILDEGHARAPGPLAGMVDCDAAVALWAVLAEARIAPGVTVNHGAVLRAFSALPLHLRRVLGPGLAERFIDIGAPESARAIRDAILRATGEHGPALQMIDARLDLEKGDTAGAEETLAAVVDGDGPLGPEALILLIDSHLDEGRPVPSPLTEDAGALAFEHREAPSGPALARVHLLGLASVGNFAAAGDELARAGPRWDAEQRREVARELLAMLARWPDDAVFLARYLADRDLFDRADPGVGMRLDVAQRLLENGFAGEARQALGSGARATEAGRLIAARAALLDRDAAQALALLAGMVGAEPAALQAEAHGLAGNHSAAAEAYRRAGLSERAAAELWRAGDWDAVRSNGTAPQQAVLALDAGTGTSNAEAALPEGPVSLAGGRALLDASRSARDAWSALLAAPGPAPAGADEPVSGSGS